MPVSNLLEGEKLDGVGTHVLFAGISVTFMPDIFEFLTRLIALLAKVLGTDLLYFYGDCLGDLVLSLMPLKPVGTDGSIFDLSEPEVGNCVSFSCTVGWRVKFLSGITANENLACP